MNSTKQIVTSEHIRSLTLSVGLLDRLLPRSRGNRYTRVEAYRYLLSRLTDQTLGEQTLLGVELDIEPGQVIITDSELAQTWGWHRATVKSFLLELEELTVLTMCRETKFSVLTFPAVKKKVAAGNKLTEPTDKPQETTPPVIFKEDTAQTDNVSEAKNSKPKTSVKNSRSKSSSVSTTQVPDLHLMSPSLFDSDDFSMCTDETHDESTKGKTDNVAPVSAGEATEQNEAPTSITIPSSHLKLAEQKSSVSDGLQLARTDDENPDIKSENENPSAEDITINNDAPDEA